MNQTSIDTLSHFLNMPLDSGDGVYQMFAGLPGAVVGQGADPLQRFVYIPGSRRDRVVLVAHIDTIWDKSYKKPFSESRGVILENGIFKSNHPGCGIGADDRAGCAMLWTLRDCGHSLLITDGEEQGKHGARYLKRHHPKLFRELNCHRYMIEFDWKGTDGCLYNQVDNTKRFKKYITRQLGFTDSQAKGGTDLGVLCKNICGVNLGVGYRGHHTNSEQLVLADWENTFHKVSAFLEGKQPRFRTLFFPRYIRFSKIAVNKVLRILHIKK